VRDDRNHKNFAKILVEVKPVVSLDWLESRIEIDNIKGNAILSSIARDSIGRKFSNCSGLNIEFMSHGEGALLDSYKVDWSQLIKYSNDNKEMLELSHRFET
jgi:hypothetical protein